MRVQVIQCIVPAIAVFDHIALVQMKIEIEEYAFQRKIESEIEIAGFPIATGTQRNRKVDSQSRGHPFVGEAESQYHIGIVAVSQPLDLIVVGIFDADRSSVEAQIGIQHQFLVVKPVRKAVFLSESSNRL